MQLIPAAYSPVHFTELLKQNGANISLCDQLELLGRISCNQENPIYSVIAVQGPLLQLHNGGLAGEKNGLVKKTDFNIHCEALIEGIFVQGRVSSREW